jgi:hypothetical protein
MALKSALEITIILTAAAATTAQNCFWRSSGTIHAIDWYACNNTRAVEGGAQLCCIGDSQCGQDSICLKDNKYYVGGCTEGTYGDAVCRTDCSECSGVSSFLPLFLPFLFPREKNARENFSKNSRRGFCHSDIQPQQPKTPKPGSNGTRTRKPGSAAAATPATALRRPRRSRPWRARSGRLLSGFRCGHQCHHRRRGLPPRLPNRTRHPANLRRAPARLQRRPKRATKTTTIMVGKRQQQGTSAPAPKPASA